MTERSDRSRSRQPELDLGLVGHSSGLGGERVADHGHRQTPGVTLASEHPGEVSLCVSHADPLQAAWILLDGRAQTEREMYQKQVGKAAILELDFDQGRVVSTIYLPTPKIAVA